MIKQLRFLGLFLLVTLACQAGQKISELPVTETLTPADTFVVNHDIGGPAPQTSIITFPLLQSLILAGSDALRDVNKLATSGVDSRLAGQTAGDAAQLIFSTRDDNTATYVRNATGILGDVDLSGISVWCDEDSGIGALKTVTLVAPDVGLSTNHVGVTVGKKYRYHSHDDSLNIELTVASVAQVGSTDISVVTFTSAAPAAIKPLTVTSRVDLLAGAPAFYINQAQKAFVGDISGAVGTVSLGQSSDSTRAPFWGAPQSGDSSHPIFAVADGKAILLATLQSNFGGVGSGPSLGFNATAINSAIAGLGSFSSLSEPPFEVAGTAARYYASATPAGGQIPVVDPATGKLNPSIIPHDDSGNTSVRWLASATIDLSASRAATLINVPAGFSAIITDIVAREPDATITDAVISIHWSTVAGEFCYSGAFDFASANLPPGSYLSLGRGDVHSGQPFLNTVLPAGPASDVLEFCVETPDSTATQAIFDVIGYFVPVP